jgi:hypothetical protein
MRSQLKRFRVTIRTAVVIATTAVAIATLWGTATSVAGQAGQPFVGQNVLPAGYKAPRTTDGQPDLNGFWQALNSANWDVEDHGAAPAPNEAWGNVEKLVGSYLVQPPGFGVVEGGPLPYTPAGLAKKKKLFDNRLKPNPIPVDNLQDEEPADPESKCFQGGVPRAMYMPFPLQIQQVKTRVLIFHTFGASSWRILHLDKTFDKAGTVDADLLDIETYNGQSIARWEGETLAVETRWFNTTVWLDRAANHYTKDAVVRERFTATSPYHLRYEVTIEDPHTFTRPVRMSMPLYRIVDPPEKLQMLELSCVEYSDEFLYGKFKKGEFVLPEVIP